MSAYCSVCKKHVAQRCNLNEPPKYEYKGVPIYVCENMPENEIGLVGPPKMPEPPKDRAYSVEHIALLHAEAIGRSLEFEREEFERIHFSDGTGTAIKMPEGEE